jgi:hypothetical protein
LIFWGKIFENFSKFFCPKKISLSMPVFCEDSNKHFISRFGGHTSEFEPNIDKNRQILSKNRSNSLEKLIHADLLCSMILEIFSTPFEQICEKFFF